MGLLTIFVFILKLADIQPLLLISFCQGVSPRRPTGTRRITSWCTTRPSQSPRTTPGWSCPWSSSISHLGQYCTLHGVVHCNTYEHVNSGTVLRPRGWTCTNIKTFWHDILYLTYYQVSALSYSTYTVLGKCKNTWYFSKHCLCSTMFLFKKADHVYNIYCIQFF